MHNAGKNPLIYILVLIHTVACALNVIITYDIMYAQMIYVQWHFYWRVLE